jgi:transcriptional regulator with PAS, ATPase and Fis domain
MMELREEIARISTTEAKVLVTGESGVGKELVARAIHTGSRRVNNPYVAMNCAGMPETLLESELFGHVKGSFTGAYRDKAGKLEMANSGTVFLDEVGEMTLRMQGLLLRFLETGELQKVGSDGPTGRVNVRVIAATNRDLRTLINEGKFREDLFYRLNVIAVHVPPLRERREDVPLLVEHFLTRFSAHSIRPQAAFAVAGSGAQAQYGSEAPAHGGYRIEPDALDALVEYPWPGNVRELENAIERIVIRTTNNLVTLADLPSEITAPRGFSVRPKRERRRTIVDDLWKKLREDGESFWIAVYPLYMDRHITRDNVRELVRRGLEEARGNYRVVAKLFNTQPSEYKRFLNFLRKHDCQLPFREFRQ